MTTNLQKKLKKARYEQEKVVMERLHSVGSCVGQYMGDGQGEEESQSVNSALAEIGPVDAAPGVDHQEDIEDDDNLEGEDSHPLFVLFDCETTGFSIYSDHITDIGAIILTSPVPIAQPTFSRLIRTPRNIPAAGKNENSNNTQIMLSNDKQTAPIFIIHYSY